MSQEPMISDIQKYAYSFAHTVLCENASETETPYPLISEIVEASKEVVEYFNESESLEDSHWALDQAFAHVSDSYHQGFNDDFSINDVRSISNIIHHANELIKALRA